MRERSRRLYGWLVRLHPPEFRGRFGREMVYAFDAAGAADARELLEDAVISLVRQWARRAGTWKIAAAALLAFAQLQLVGLGSLKLAHRILTASAALREGPEPSAMTLLLVAGAVAGVLLAVTALAVWIGRLCRKTGSRTLYHLAPLAALALLGALHGRAQQADTRPVFEVTSVKVNNSGCPNGRGGGQGAPQPGMLRVKCIAVSDLIQAAYGTFANGPTPDPRELRVIGAPGWMGSDLFDVEAKPAGNASIDAMYGPMLQRLLEERFQLKIHRETRDAPVYALTVSEKGARLPPTREGSCVSPQPTPPPHGAKICGGASYSTTGGKTTVDAAGVGMASFAGVTLSRVQLGRPVIDRTGLSGLFDVHLEFAALNAAGASDAPSIFSAVQEQLGLKLSASTAPVGVLVVDHIEKPQGN